MKVNLKPREITGILTALRCWDDLIPEEERDSFDHYRGEDSSDSEHSPLTSKQVDKLCQNLKSIRDTKEQP